jgi:hypothetical protein
MIKLTERQYKYLGLLSILFYISHSLSWIIKGVPANLLWTCHLASFFIGISLIFNFSLLNSISVQWLGIGNIIWIIYLFGGGDFEPTSGLTHWGGLIIGLIGINKMGIKKYSSLYALSLMFIFQQLTKYITPEKENINLAFYIPEGWEKYFSSYILYELYLGAVCLGSFLMIELICIKLLKKRSQNFI